MSLLAETAPWVEDEHRIFSNTAHKLFADGLAPNIEKWAEAGIVKRDFCRVVGAQGFRRWRNVKKLGMKGSDTAELFFKQVRVPNANLLGQPDPERGSA